MAAVLDVTPENAWTALRRRLQQDRVGAVSLGIVVVYLVMILFAMAGLLARGWSEEVGVPYANPSLLGDRPNLEAALAKRMEHKGKVPDLRDIDPGFRIDPGHRTVLPVVRGSRDQLPGGGRYQRDPGRLAADHHHAAPRMDVFTTTTGADGQPMWIPTQRCISSIKAS